MKYMGSKKAMLKNGLGSLIIEQAKTSDRFFDAFAGSSIVTWFVAENTYNKVISGDLQKYSSDIANSIILRTSPLTAGDLNEMSDWINRAKYEYENQKKVLRSVFDIETIYQNRYLSSQSEQLITKAYGGYYFSYNQSLMLDLLLKYAPTRHDLNAIALTSIIEAASYCSASPGHTAQPLKPSTQGLKAINDAWSKSPYSYVEKTVSALSSRFANKKGHAVISDALSLLNDLSEDDIVFIDPPYSSVHYSRFYHVFETISRNEMVEVSGNGRYPSAEKRPRSEFSLKGKSFRALENLFIKINEKKAKAILTFPSNACSNGLNGDIVKNMCKKYFSIKKEIIEGTFSTLGGNNDNRPPRQKSTEMVLLLNPK